jgi:hypothetical protein
VKAEERVRELRQRGVDIRMNSKAWPPAEDLPYHESGERQGLQIYVKINHNNVRRGASMIIMDKAAEDCYFDIVEWEWHRLIDRLLKEAGIDV